MDMVIGVWPEFVSLNFREEYLREAATMPNPPSATVDVRDGKPPGCSLGLFEDWNHSKDCLKYKKIEIY